MHGLYETAQSGLPNRLSRAAFAICSSSCVAFPGREEGISHKGKTRSNRKCC